MTDCKLRRLSQDQTPEGQRRYWRKRLQGAGLNGPGREDQARLLAFLGDPDCRGLLDWTPHSIQVGRNESVWSETDVDCSDYFAALQALGRFPSGRQVPCRGGFDYQTPWDESREHHGEDCSGQCEGTGQVGIRISCRRCEGRGAYDESQVYRGGRWGCYSCGGKGARRGRGWIPEPMGDLVLLLASIAAAGAAFDHEEAPAVAEVSASHTEALKAIVEYVGTGSVDSYCRCRSYWLHRTYLWAHTWQILDGLMGNLDAGATNSDCQFQASLAASVEVLGQSEAKAAIRAQLVPALLNSFATSQSSKEER